MPPRSRSLSSRGISIEAAARPPTRRDVLDIGGGEWTSPTLVFQDAEGRSTSSCGGNHVPCASEPPKILYPLELHRSVDKKGPLPLGPGVNPSRRLMARASFLLCSLAIAAIGCDGSGTGLPVSTTDAGSDGAAGDQVSSDGGLTADMPSGPDTPSCPDVLGTFGMLAATGPGCGDLDEQAPQCIQGSAAACAVHFVSMAAGSIPAAVNGGAALRGDGSFADAMLYFGTAKRSGCRGRWDSGTSTMTVSCGGGADACDVTMVRTSPTCP